MISKKIKIVALIVASVLFISLLPTNTVKASEAGVIDAAYFRGHTDITKVHIGSDVTEITSGAFRCLINLQSITVSEKNPFYSSYSNCLYDKEKTVLLCFPPALSGALIPKTVVAIGENALHGVGDSLKRQIQDLVHSQANGNLMEWDVPGEHFIHTEYGVKWRGADGTLKAPDTELMKLTASVVEECTNGNMTQQTQLERCFDYYLGIVDYQREMDVPIGDWTGQYACDVLLTGKGNCYKYAAGFAYIAKGLGFESRVCSGTVTASTGGRTGHAWTEVKINDKWYIFDTEMQDAKGSGYYKVTYDTYPAGPLEKMATWTVYY